MKVLQRDAKTGCGRTVSQSIRIAPVLRCSGSTEISRVELKLTETAPPDLVLQIRSGMNPPQRIGTPCSRKLVPKEFIPETKTYWSVPHRLIWTQLPGQYYWLVVVRNGDATNKLDWIERILKMRAIQRTKEQEIAEYGQLGNALHFKVFSGESGELIHGIYAGTGYTTVLYEGELITKVCRYLPSCGWPGGWCIRDVWTLN